ncbi:MAG: ABC transporter ATP-binding protein [Clostridiales bacterium]|jgi:peptide/nickel transport system ATP-binding protein|nr:ABC transporter ATP-binding protein [Clostridiales bacterium]
MNKGAITLQDVSVTYRTPVCETNAVSGMSFTLEQGGRLGIIGESGSGKTTTSLAIMGLLGKYADVSGQIFYNDIDIQAITDARRDDFRWKKIAIVFQNSLDILNPVLTVREQIIECIDRHMHFSKDKAAARMAELLNEVGLDPKWAESYPNQLSGGMRQRVLIAMALSCDPEVLIVDEPTTALDAIAKSEIIGLIDRLQKEKNFSLIVSSHEMSTIQKLTDQTMVMYLGNVVEYGKTEDVIFSPTHPYTRGLINSSTQINSFRDLWGIPQEDVPYNSIGCPFRSRCSQCIDMCAKVKPQLKECGECHAVACNRGGVVKVMEGCGISKDFYVKGRKVAACRNVDICIRSGEVVALIGESGSGKTTLANILCGMLEKDGGEVVYEGEKLRGFAATRRQGGVQITFQDSFSSINEHFTIFQAIEEPLKLLKIGTPEERLEMVTQVLRDVQLPSDECFYLKKCFMLSGGQRQRVAIARSLVMKPKLLIADEISSMLDPSTQANILRLLKGLQNSKGFSMLYITHDLSLARKIADRVYIMKNGEIIEEGSALSVFQHPNSEYTKRLLMCADL